MHIISHIVEGVIFQGAKLIAALQIQSNAAACFAIEK